MDTLKAKIDTTWIEHHLYGLEIHSDYINVSELVFYLVSLIIGCVLAWLLARGIMLRIIKAVIKRTKTDWDDILLKRKFFNALAHIAPAIIVDATAELVFIDYPYFKGFALTVSHAYIVFIVILVINSLINALGDILIRQPQLQDKPIVSYMQLLKIVNAIVGIVLILSIIIGRSPLYFFSAMGAMTAVLIIVFKDTILGFMASIHLAMNDMVRVGDWISMPKYGADGDVVEINLASVKVQNWDMTISTIPTYAFVSDSFVNWRGMSESGGRRIKRSLNINIKSVKFCTPEMVERFKKIHLIKDYVESRQNEINQYNQERKIDESILVNGRHMTNVGVFRKYVDCYIKANPNLHEDMMRLVRQLAPTETGVPIEVYAFSKDQRWIEYENITGDIFDHLYAVVPEFGLEVFQNPTGEDFRSAFKKTDSPS